MRKTPVAPCTPNAAHVTFFIHLSLDSHELPLRPDLKRGPDAGLSSADNLLLTDAYDDVMCETKLADE